MTDVKDAVRFPLEVSFSPWGLGDVLNVPHKVMISASVKSPTGMA